MERRRRRSAVCGWDNCPASVKQLVGNVLDDFRAILGDSLIGFYLHGSLPMGCFVPGDSDIDSLAVVKRRLAFKKKKKAIIAALLSQTTGPAVGDLEMSVVTKAFLDDFVYPTPYELYFNGERSAEYAAGRGDYLAGGEDEDLAAHFTAIRQSGICLHGRPVNETFPEVSRELFVKSLLGDAD